MKRASAEQAAKIIQHDDMVASGNFTLAGSSGVLPSATAQRARKRYRNGQSFQTYPLTGASIGAAADDVLSAADAVSWHVPYQTSAGLCEKINRGQAKFADLHLSEVVQMVNYDFFGEIDVAVIKAFATMPNDQIWLSSGIDNTLAWLLRAEKVIIELNHYHNSRMAELANIMIPGVPPRRSSVPILHTMDCVGSQYAQIDPKGVVVVTDTELPDAGNAVDRTSPASQQIADNVVTFLLAEMTRKHTPAELLPLQSGVGNISNAIMTRSGENPDIPPSMMYSEVLQESVVHLLGTSKIAGVSASSLTILASSLWKIYDNMDFPADRITLCPQKISNNPEIIRRLGVIALSVGLEFDIYGHVSSTHVVGVNPVSGTGGGGDSERNAYLSIFMASSIAEDGKISTIVSMRSHVGHSEHSVKVVMTEQRITDLRGLFSVQWTHTIVDNCTHLPHRDYLYRYLGKAPSGYVHHDLSHVLGLHRNLPETGSILGQLTLPS